jgi:hypothetical protein
MRSLTGRPSLHLLSLSLPLGVSLSPLYLSLFFFLLLHLNINIINSAPTNNIITTGQKLIRVSGDQSITSVNDTIRYLNTIPKALQFTHQRQILNRIIKLRETIRDKIESFFIYTIKNSS